MCRLAAFPPNCSKEDALKILLGFASGNPDGAGSVYVKDGHFKVNKWPISLRQVLSEKLPLLDHMPYPGWTMVHLRAASHGDNIPQNTHPFIKGNWAFCHNGIWRDYSIVKAAFSRLYRFEGQTDSEVAAQMFAAAGPRKFIRSVKDGGVYLALHRSGKLYAVCTEGGDMSYTETPNGIIVASTFPEYTSQVTIDSGWLKLNPEGTLVKKRIHKSAFLLRSDYWRDYKDDKSLLADI